MNSELACGVIERDRWCPVCGVYLDSVHLHHRRLRSQGGKDSYSNLIAIHPACHQRVHASPAAAYEAGWMVPSWAQPEEWPLRLPDGRTIRLSPDGDVTSETGATDGWRSTDSSDGQAWV